MPDTSGEGVTTPKPPMILVYSGGSVHVCLRTCSFCTPLVEVDGEQLKVDGVEIMDRKL